MKGIKAEAQDRVSCDFTTKSFDLKVVDFQGKSFRLFKDNLADKIVPSSSQVVVKKNTIVVRLTKEARADGSYDEWSSLTAKPKSKMDEIDKNNPSSGIMTRRRRCSLVHAKSDDNQDCLQEIYEDGDETTRRMIGEAMSKKEGVPSRRTGITDDY